MEDTATAEISRAQLWQWLHHQTPLAGTEGNENRVTLSLYQKLRDEEVEKLGGRSFSNVNEAADLLDSLVSAEEFVEFLTLDAYAKLP